MRKRLLIVLLLGSCAAGTAMAERDKKPFELVRELQVFQSQAVLSGNNASAEQRERVAKVAEQLAQYDASAWSDPRSARAAVIYVLAGGDPRVLKKLAGSGTPVGIDEKLVKGALAYGERRDKEATEILESVDIDNLDRSIGGHVALVRALLMAKNDQRTAYALLDRARLLAPGTMVEEAALRRQAVLAAKMNELGAFESLSSQYFRRFSKSIFARSFERNFAEEIVSHTYTADADRMKRLEMMLRSMTDEERTDTCLALAEVGIGVANVTLVRFATRLAGLNARSRAIDATRMMLFEAAAAIVTSDYEQGSLALRVVDKSKLGVREEALLYAALAVAAEISRPPSPGAALRAPDATDDEPAEPDSPVVSAAQQAIAQADGLLSEADR